MSVLVALASKLTLVYSTVSIRMKAHRYNHIQWLILSGKNKRTLYLGVKEVLMSCEDLKELVVPR